MAQSLIDILEDSWIGRIIGLVTVVFIGILALLTIYGPLGIEDFVKISIETVAVPW